MGADEKQKVKIGGIKISETLMGVSVVSPSHKGLVNELCRGLSLKQINTPYISYNLDNEHERLFLLIAPDDLHGFQIILSDRDINRHNVVYHDTLTLFSIFPVRGNLTILGRSLAALHRVGVKIHGVCSSLSSLVYVIETTQIDDAVETITRSFELPADHTPFRPLIKIRQTKIKNEDDY